MRHGGIFCAAEVQRRQLDHGNALDFDGNLLVSYRNLSEIIPARSLESAGTLAMYSAPSG